GTLDSMASAIQTWVQAQDSQLSNATVAFNSSGQLTINLGTDAYSIGFRDEQSPIKGSGQQDAAISLDLDGDGQVDKTTYGFSNFLGLTDFFVSTPNLTEWTSGFKPANYTLTTTAPRTLSFADSANPTGIAGATITVNPADSLETIAAAINANLALR